MKTKNPVVWFEIYVSDLERAQNFYEKVLDIKLSTLPTPGDIKDEMEMMAFPMEMNGEGAAGALVKVKTLKSGGNSTIVYFGSEDCSVEESRIDEAGGEIVKSKASLGEFGFMVLAYDTEGNKFGVYSES